MGKATETCTRITLGAGNYHMKWFPAKLRTMIVGDKPMTIKQPTEGSTASHNEGTSPARAQYSADVPMTDPTKDRFSRFPFAQRLAQTIASRQDPRSIVIGIYGPWGDGKTTVLNFIRQELDMMPHVIPISFNPWRYQDENELLRGFYVEVSDALKRSLTLRREKLGRQLEKYGDVVSTLTLGRIDKLKEIGTNLSTVEIDQKKEMLYKILKEEQKRAVIFMDDIDRLENAEIQAVFRLVKLSADAPYTTYILAFDPEMVEAALEERYGGGRPGAGRNFIEKIIQVPLHLPRASTFALRDYCFEAIDEAVREANIELSEGQVQSFVQHFNEGLLIRLRTPRTAIRYGNALVFSLPLLKGEVNYVDLMLIEGIRIFYPHLYNSIRNNPDVLLGLRWERLLERSAGQNSALSLLNTWMEGLTGDEREAATRLVGFLFPRFGRIIDGETESVYLNEAKGRWAEQQRVTSEQYFDRYFSYTVIRGDISDLEIDAFLAQIGSRSPDEISFEITKFVTEGSPDILVTKLQLRRQRLAPQTSRSLALAIARNSDLFQGPQGSLQYSSPLSQAGLLTAELTASIPDGQERFNTAKQIALESQSPLFAAGWFRWLHSSETERERVLSNEEEKEVGRLIAERVSDLAKKAPITSQYPMQFPLLLRLWSTFGSRDEVAEYVANAFNSNPDTVVDFLQPYLGHALWLDGARRL
jgi:hypothetical protein